LYFILRLHEIFFVLILLATIRVLYLLDKLYCQVLVLADVSFVRNKLLTYLLTYLQRTCPTRWRRQQPLHYLSGVCWLVTNRPITEHCLFAVSRLSPPASV